jgi:hypothetical protein
VHRTTFTRQAANLWKAKEYLWEKPLAETPHDPTFALADSFPLPAVFVRPRLPLPSLQRRSRFR